MKIIKKVFCLITAVIICVGFDSSHIFAASMSTSESGLSLIKGFEGCKLTAYKALSTEKYYTIGYGHYGPDVYAGMTITQSQAEEMLRNDLKKYENYVNTFLNKYGISVAQNQFDALVSFTYNLGNVWVSTSEFLLKTYLINGVGNYTSEQVTTAFTNWSKSGGNFIQGLFNRRKKEAEYFLGQGPRRIDETVDTSYQTPYECEPIADSGLITVYNVYGTPYSASVHNIAYNDWCTIHEVYTSGYCKVTYPLSGGGSHTEYAKADDFPIPKKGDLINQIIDTSYQTPYECEPNATSGLVTVYNEYGTAYSTSVHNIAYNDRCTIHEVYTSGYCKLTYPLSSGGTHTEYAKADDFPIPQKGNLINQIIDTSYQTPYECEPITTSGLVTVYNEYGTAYSTSVHNIAYNDRCTIHEVYTSGYCKVTYPLSSGGTHTEYAKASDFPIPIKHEHSYGSWKIVKSATCNYDGQESRTCSSCGESETRAVAALGHDYSGKVISPTFTEQGYTLHTCSVCGESYKDDYIDPKIKGDINNDSLIGISDVVFLEKYLVKLVKSDDISHEQFLAADMNSDGQVNVFDVIILKRILLGV